MYPAIGTMEWKRVSEHYVLRCPNPMSASHTSNPCDVLQREKKYLSWFKNGSSEKVPIVNVLQKQF